MKTLLIGGYYGAGNLGDEAILECMLKDLRARRKDLHFIVLSWNPLQTARRYNVEAVHWQDISALLEAGKRADLILLGGGGLFQDYWGIAPETYLRRTAFTITSYGSLPLLAKLLGIPCMIYAQGVGPLKSELAREHVRQAFERCQVITLRDPQSFLLLQECGFSPSEGQTVEITADPAFTLEVNASIRQQAKSILTQVGIPLEADLISVSLRYWDQFAEGTRWVTNLVAGLNAYLAENSGTHVLFVPFQVNEVSSYTDDRSVLREVRLQISYSERTYLIENEIPPQLMQAIFERSSLVLGMRLHASILAINAGVPFVALPYDPKVMSLLRQTGLEEYGMPSLDFSGEELLALLRKAAENKNALRQHLSHQRRIQQQKAFENVSLALSLLERSSKRELTFPQEFALENLRLMEKMDIEMEMLRQQIRALEKEIEHLSATLNSIYASRFWKLITFYRRIKKLCDVINFLKRRSTIR